MPGAITLLPPIIVPLALAIVTESELSTELTTAEPIFRLNSDFSDTKTL